MKEIKIKMNIYHIREYMKEIDEKNELNKN